MPPLKIHGFHSFQPPYKGFLCRSAVFNVRLSVASASLPGGISGLERKPGVLTLLEGTLGPQGRESLTDGSGRTGEKRQKNKVNQGSGEAKREKV